jgi:hypothetical protein
MERLLHCARHYPGRYLEALAKAGPRWQSQARAAYKFCFVRHPLAWYESYWLFMRGRGWNAWGVTPSGRRRWHPNAALDGLGDADFNRFARNVLRRRPGYVSEMYSWYATPEIDFVGVQERLAGDLAAVLRHLGVEFDSERLTARDRVNVSTRHEGEPAWDEGLRAEMEAAEHAAIARFGYNHGADDASRRRVP